MISQESASERVEQLLDQAIAEFLRADAAGNAGDRQQWLDRYPECAEFLAGFFDDRERVDRVVSPIRVDRPVAGGDGDATGLYSPAVFAQPSVADNTIDLSPEPPMLSSTRYRPLSFHARGGMGEIWVARDEKIGRNVAVKKLRPGREPQKARFVVEAQITGQLEHPSVVPLHDIGVDDAGNPFYVMKLVRGRRLKDAIAEFHAQKRHRDWSSDLEFRRLLETFVTVCNVVAYAHHKGVLHRDIKPDNVMLGSYGETLVVDWGLAKVIGQSEEQQASFVRLSGSGSTATQQGAIVGSPFYMSPEGAEGRPEAVDQSSDVYLLGATLYEILCNRPPRQATSSWELIDLALHSRPTAPRKVEPYLPRPLDAICMKAMAFDKRDRYESPMALAGDVERYLGGAPTIAYREPLLARGARWIRRHRRSILQGAAALLVLGLVAFSFHSFRQARLFREREEARQQLVKFHRLAEEAQFYAANTDAISERVPIYDPHRAQKAGEAAMAIVNSWGETAEDLPLVDQQIELLKAKYALLLLMAQSRLQGTPSATEARQSLALLDRASIIQPTSRGNFVLRAQCHELLGDARAAEADRYQANAPDIAVTAQDHFLEGELLRLQDVGASARKLDTGSADVSRAHLASAMGEYRKALALNPQHFWARYQLGRCLFALGRGAEAIEALSACVALRPTSAWAYSTRGLASAFAGRTDEGIEDLDRALRIDPDFQPARLNRGVVRWSKQEDDAAMADLTAVLAAPAERRLSEAAFFRGQVFLQQNRDRDALNDFSLVVADRPQFQSAYWFRAKTHFRLGDAKAGLLDVKTFLTLDRGVPKSDVPSNQHLRFGRALRTMAQQLPDAARTEPLRVAAKELRSAIESGPPSAEMWQQLGAVRELLGSDAEAVDAYSHGLALDADNVVLRNMRAWKYTNDKKYDLAEADFAESIRLAPQNAEAHAGLGYVLAELGRQDAARQEASAAILAAADNQLILHNVACIYGRLSSSDSKHRIEYENLALASLDRAVTLSKHQPLGPDANEIELIREELAFPESLKSRPEFQRLIK